MSKKLLSPEDFALPAQAVDLVKESIRSGVEFDAFGDRQTFTAMALTNAVALTKVEASGYGTATDGLNLGSGLRYKFKARIIDEDSPHLFLPDPCELARTGDKDGTISAIAKHTDFIQLSVEGNKVSAGDIVEVTMRKNIFSYDLQLGIFNKILAFNDNAASLLKDVGCSTLADSFDFAALPPKVVSLDTSDIGPIDVVRNNSSTIIRPEQHGYLTALVKQLQAMQADPTTYPEPDGGYIKKITVTDGYRDSWAFARIILNKVKDPTKGWSYLFDIYQGKNAKYLLTKLQQVKDRVDIDSAKPNVAPWVKIFETQLKKNVWLSYHQLNLAVDIGTTMFTGEQVRFLARAAQSLGSSAGSSTYGTRSFLGEPIGGYWKSANTVALERASPNSIASDEHLHIAYILPSTST